MIQIGRILIFRFGNRFFLITWHGLIYWLMVGPFLAFLLGGLYFAEKGFIFLCILVAFQLSEAVIGIVPVIVTPNKISKMFFLPQSFLEKEVQFIQYSYSGKSSNLVVVLKNKKKVKLKTIYGWLDRNETKALKDFFDKNTNFKISS